MYTRETGVFGKYDNVFICESYGLSCFKRESSGHCQSEGEHVEPEFGGKPGGTVQHGKTADSRKGQTIERLASCSEMGDVGRQQRHGCVFPLDI